MIKNLLKLGCGCIGCLLSPIIFLLVISAIITVFIKVGPAWSVAIVVLTVMVITTLTLYRKGKKGAGNGLAILTTIVTVGLLVAIFTGAIGQAFALVAAFMFKWLGLILVGLAIWIYVIADKDKGLPKNFLVTFGIIMLVSVGLVGQLVLHVSIPSIPEFSVETGIEGRATAFVETLTSPIRYVADAINNVAGEANRLTTTLEDFLEYLQGFGSQVQDNRSPEQIYDAWAESCKRFPLEGERGYTYRSGTPTEFRGQCFEDIFLNTYSRWGEFPDWTEVCNKYPSATEPGYNPEAEEIVSRGQCFEKAFNAALLGGSDAGIVPPPPPEAPSQVE